MVLVQGCRSSCALCVLGRLGLNQCLEVPCCAAGRAAARLQVASSRVRWCHTSPATLPAQPARGVPCCVVGTQSSAASRRLLEQAVPLWLCQASTGAGTAPHRAWWRHRHKLGWALRLPSKCSLAQRGNISLLLPAVPLVPLCSWGAPEGQRSKVFATSRPSSSQLPCVSLVWVPGGFSRSPRGEAGYAGFAPFSLPADSA